MVTWKGWCDGDRQGEKWIIMEYVAGGDIQSFLYPKQKGVSLPSFERRMGVARDVAIGMTELHSRRPPLLYVFVSRFIGVTDILHQPSRFEATELDNRSVWNNKDSR